MKTNEISMLSYYAETVSTCGIGMNSVLLHSVYNLLKNSGFKARSGSISSLDNSIHRCDFRNSVLSDEEMYWTRGVETGRVLGKLAISHFYA